MNHDSRFWPEPPRQHLEVARLERDAACGRREARPCHMDKDRAAKSGNPRAGVVVDLDDDVVEPVGAPKPVAWFIGQPLKGMIVTPVVDVLAPSIGGANATKRKERPRANEPIGSPPQPHGVKPPTRRTAVALPLIRPDAGTAERDRHAPGAGEEPALRGPSRPCTNVDQVK